MPQTRGGKDDPALAAWSTGPVIVVTGTHRSGTSLWMQILATAGLEVIGERFPEGWDALFADANPDGFYESALIGGIYFRTNPHPVTGDYLHPAVTRTHAVKVFIPGLVRTDLAFLDRVLATVRDWRNYCASAARMRELGRTLAPTDIEDRARAEMPPALSWWSQNYALIRDLAIRGYPVHVTSYAALLRDPTRVITEVVNWLDLPVDTAALERAIAQVRPRSAVATPSAAANVHFGAELPPGTTEAFDALYETIDRGENFTPALIQTLNETDERLRDLLLEHHARARLASARELLDPAAPPK